MSAVRLANSSGFYVVGGTMRPDSQSYVVRDSDEELYQGLLANEFCHVLTSRQMGKSSLMLRTAARLREAGIEIAVLDLTGIGTNLTPEQWYTGMLVQLGDRLDLETELLDFWWANVALGPMQRWVTALRKIVLPQRTGRLVIFVDEIDAVASLNFSTDEFFAGIRECYNLRNEDADMNRLTFCLLGVVNPADLIRETRTTPFNVGRRIELSDFKLTEALRLADGLGRDDCENQALLKRIMYWTNGHPYLTQRLCQAVAENAAQGVLGNIDESIERMFVSKQAQAYDDNLIFVRERLLRSGADVTALLNLYARVRRRKKVADDDSQAVSILKLSGVARAEGGRLRVSNRIYERVFDIRWIRQNLPGAELRRRRAAFRRGVLRTAAVAALILAIMAALAGVAFRQRNLARAQAALNRQLLYVASMKLANQEYENANIARVERLVEDTRPLRGEEDLRGFEWFLFWRYAHSEMVRIQEPGQIASAKFFDGNDTIAIAELIPTMSRQKRAYMIKLYDRRLAKETLSFEVPAGTNFIIAVFSPDNKYVATDAPDKSVALWDLASQQQVHTFLGSGNAVSALVFSADQKSLAGAFTDGNFRVWDLKTGTQKFEGYSEVERPSIAFSPDGKYLAVAMTEYITKIFDIATGKPVRTVLFPKGPAALLFFSPDGTKLFAATIEGYIYCWNLLVQKLLDFKERHASEVMSFSFSPDGNTVATSSVDRTIKLWDVDTGTLRRTLLGHGIWVTSVHWSMDGEYLLSGDRDGMVKMWDLNLKEMPVWPRNNPLKVTAITFSPTNELIAIGRGVDGKLGLWNLSGGQWEASLDVTGEVISTAFSQDSTMVAVAIEPQIRIYRVRTGKLISTLEAPAKDAYSLDFSPDGTKLLSGDRHGNVIISDVFSGHQNRRLDSGNIYYRAVFSSDGKLIASADQDGKVRIWDVGSGRIIRTLLGHTAPVRLIKFSPNDQLLATAAEDNSVRIWDPASGKELSRTQSESVQRLAFSPDRRRLATASQDGAVVLWNSDGMQNVITLRRDGPAPTSLTFSADGLSVAVSDEKGDVRVWQGSQPHS
jgi:WD40 repeat protein